MAFKSIAVFIEPTPAGEARISYAVRMASRYGAHLIGIFLVPFVSVGSDSVAETFVEGRQAIQQVIAAYQATEAAVIDDAKRDFSACCTREDLSFEFRFLHQGDFHDGIALNCMVSVERVQSHGEPVAKIILAYADRHDTDLIVVGAYSHNRTTEMIFGGVTRSLLRDAAIPLLIAH